MDVVRRSVARELEIDEKTPLVLSFYDGGAMIYVLTSSVNSMGVENQEAWREIAKLRGVRTGYPPIQMSFDANPAILEEARRILNTILTTSKKGLRRANTRKPVTKALS